MIQNEMLFFDFSKNFKGSRLQHIGKLVCLFILLRYIYIIYIYIYIYKCTIYITYINIFIYTSTIYMYIMYAHYIHC